MHFHPRNDEEFICMLVRVHLGEFDPREIVGSLYETTRASHYQIQTTQSRKIIMLLLGTAGDVKYALISLLCTAVASEIKVGNVFAQSGACATLDSIDKGLSRLAGLTCGPALTANGGNYICHGWNSSS